MPRIYGYIRTSRALQETVPGMDPASQERRGWHRLNGRLAGGDILVVDIDRIGRTWQDTVRSICDLGDRGVKIRSLAEAEPQ